ncbi:15794_t:CDS:2 [Cetraspora pellucida]|uniref:15794_t:CDS:1 n=1 Tax=Cetraspora pellucida TaxID=1433469 RepID=A0A9N9JLP0_9GLOM|nr:15794_t:CDS:2 [Cetraspora pellucida]
MIQNSVSWHDIDFDQFYVRIYKQCKPKEKFDLLEHVIEVKLKDYFICKCKKNHEFYEHLWQYDPRDYKNNYCPFRMLSNYFKLLQSVDKKLDYSEKLVRVNSKESLIFDYTGTQIYKNEVKLLDDFKKYINRKVVTNTRQHLSDTSNNCLGEIPSFYDIFIKKLNELDSVKTFTDYKYPLNKGVCWNCKRIGFSHTCCVACKQEFEQCDCKFICGLTYPTQYDKCGRQCQFAKCRYFTNNLNKVIHHCKGKTKNFLQPVALTNPFKPPLEILLEEDEDD